MLKRAYINSYVAPGDTKAPSSVLHHEIFFYDYLKLNMAQNATMRLQLGAPEIIRHDVKYTGTLPNAPCPVPTHT